MGVPNPLEGDTEIRKRKGDVGEVEKSDERELEKDRRTRSRFMDTEEGEGDGTFLEEEREPRSHRMRTNAVSR